LFFAAFEQSGRETAETVTARSTEKGFPEQDQGAIGLFTDRYDEKVKGYTIGDFSKEICGGSHMENIGALGHFRLQKEEAGSAGVRRIRGVLE